MTSSLAREFLQKNSQNEKRVQKPFPTLSSETNFSKTHRIKLPTVSKPFPTRCIPWLALCAVHFAEKTGPKCPIKIPTTKTKAYFISNSFLDFVSGRSFVHFHTYKDSAALLVWQGSFYKKFS
ncbi:MAG TPA: hypothetical protein PLO49_07655 [Methanofastidiosum sp.]|nr:hypothetical protein [Methanofastidiosum sp.]